MAENGTANRSGAADDGHSDHQKLYHLVYVAGITLLTGVVDFAFLWPEWHLGALLVFAAWLSLVAIYEFRSSQHGLAITVPVFLFVAALIGNFIIGPVQIPETEVVGSLQPGAEPDPPNDCLATKSPDTWRIMIGASAIQFAEPTEVNLLKIGACPVLSIKKDASGIAIAANVFDASGRLIAKIENNEFHALIGAQSHIERYHSLNKLGVIAAAGATLLYVEYLNKETVRIRGLFGCPGHALVPVRDNEPIPGIFLNGHCLNMAKGVRFREAVFGAR
jgi:hypothetical protein